MRVKTSLEGPGQYLLFGETTNTEGGVSTTTSQTKYFLAGGARFFLGKYLNAHVWLGLGRTVVESGMNVTEINLGLRFKL